MKNRGLCSLAFVLCVPFWGVSAVGSAQVSTVSTPAASASIPAARAETGPPPTVVYSSSTAALSLAPDPVPDAVAVAPDPIPDALPDAPTPAASGSSQIDRSSERNVTWKSLPGDFLHDQKEIWGVFPGQLAHGRHWVPVLAVAGITAGLIYADPHIMPYFRSHAKNIDKLNDVFDPMITTGEVIAMPAGLLAAGYIRHDEYQVSSGLMGALAYGDSLTLNLVIKAITRRQRPSDVPTGRDYADTFFNGGKSPLKGSSFPSGHATAAFSVATVVSYRYRNHKWVPWAAYGLATAIGLSRIATQAHFASDVFLGSAIGYTVARYQTVRPQ
jgi:membrane-associated phospholipid phosphatase